MGTDTTRTADPGTAISAAADEEPVFLEVVDGDVAVPPAAVSSAARSPARAVPQSVANDAAGVAPRPAWFQGNRPEEPALGRAAANQRAGRRRRKLLVVADGAEDRERTWRQRIAFWWGWFAATGYASSLALHAAILVLLWFMIQSGGLQGTHGLTLTAGEKDSVDFDSLLDTRLGPESPEEPEPPVPQTVALEALQEELSSDVADRIASELNRGLKQSLPEAGGGNSDPAGTPGANVVTKGSFSAWTIPEDPPPLRNYFIVIRVKLPEKITRIRASDLTAAIAGTDNYRQILSWNRGRPDRAYVKQPGRPPQPLFADRFLPVRDGYAELWIDVPGGERLIKDEITVNSRVLRETQTLEIEF